MAGAIYLLRGRSFARYGTTKGLLLAGNNEVVYTVSVCVLLLIILQCHRGHAAYKRACSVQVAQLEQTAL